MAKVKRKYTKRSGFWKRGRGRVGEVVPGAEAKDTRSLVVESQTLNLREIEQAAREVLGAVEVIRRHRKNASWLVKDSSA